LNRAAKNKEIRMRIMTTLCAALMAALFTVAAQGAADQRAASKSSETSAEVRGPEIGEVAPNFTLPIATKDTILFEGKSLSDFLGRGPVVLAFYPADWSGGCTKEVCALRDAFSEFEKLGATVIGISGDYVFSHKEWAQHHNLPFWLASDHSGKVSTQYASHNPATGYNKRTVYVLSKDGAVRYKNLAFRAGNDEDFKALKDAVLAIR
jgi:peroxiredoxin Q/BCP